MYAKPFPFVIALLAMAPAAHAQIVGGVMGVTGAEMH